MVKFYLFICFSFLSSFLYAQPPSPKPPQVPEEPITPDQPYAYLHPTEKSYVYVQAEWLYWKPFAQIPFADLITIKRFDADSSIEYPDDDQELTNRFSFQSGYRVKGGINLPYPGWDVYAQYQSICDSASKSVSIADNVDQNTISRANDTKALFPYWLGGVIQGVVNSYKWVSTSARQKIEYHTFDSALNKTFYVRPRFAMTPNIGVRGLWLKNTLDVTYVGFAGINNPPNPIQDVLSILNEFCGWGLRSGLNMSWLLEKGVEISGSAFISSLVGDFKNKQTDNFIDHPGSVDVQGSLSRETKISSIKNVFELTIGARWGRKFCNERFYFGLQFDYEFTYLPNIIRLNRYSYSPFPQTTSNPAFAPTIFAAFENDVSMHGISLGGRFDF